MQQSPTSRTHHEVNMLCREVMKGLVEYIGPAETVQSAARRMREANVGFLPVCDPAGQVLGTVTDRDLVVRSLADGAAPDRPVGQVMSTDVVTCLETDAVGKAHELMRAFRKSRIVCVDAEGRLCGVISLSDLATRAAPDAVETLRRIASREVST